MNITQKDIKKLLDQKKEKVTTSLEQEKIAVIENLLKNDAIFFELDINTAIGILAFLDIPREQLKATYFSLISPASYKHDAPKSYITTSDIR